MKLIISRILLHYFRILAKIQLKKFAPDIIGITGSAGKTSCRNAVSAIIQDKYKTKVSYKANSESGIPLNVLDLAPTNYTILDWLRLVLLAPIQLFTNWLSYEKYIVEMGVDSPQPPKNMEYLLSIIRPRTAIFLNAYPVHTQEFRSLIQGHTKKEIIASARSLIAAEKGKLIQSLPENGLAVLNADDPYVIKFKHDTQAQVMTYGQSRTNHVSIRSVKINATGTTFTFQTHKETASLTLAQYLLPDHFAYTFAAGICIGLDEDFTLEESCALIEKNFRLPKGRATLLQGINNSLIIDSSYNASAQPTIDMLKLLHQIKGQRKIALLGDMRELGGMTRTEHENVAHHASKVCDQVFLVGPLMHQYAQPILSARLGIQNSHLCKNADTAATAIKQIIKAGDVLLIKGSQNTIFLESAVKKLMQDQHLASLSLCRQTKFWQKKRRSFGLSG